MQELIIYTDGGSHGNPGPGGWAYVASSATGLAEASGSVAYTTNNKMELQAVIEALQHAKRIGEGTSVTVRTDSQYVKNGITSWIKTWLKNGWKTAAKKPVKNQELWRNLYTLDSELDVEWQWVRGHAGNELNERCDELVQLAIARVE